MWTKGFNDSPAQKNVEGGLFLRGRTQWRAGGITWTVFLVFYDRHPTGGHRLCSLVVPVCSTMPSRRPRKTEEARDFERPRKKKITGTFPKHFQSVKRLFAFFFVLPALRVTSAPCGPGGPCCGTVPTRVQCFLSLSLSLSLSVFLFFPFCLGNFYKWTTCRAPGSVACQQLEGGALGGARWRTPATPSSSSTSSVDAVKTSCKRITSDTFFFFVCVCVCVFAVVSSPAGRTSYPPTYLGQRSGRNKKIDSSYRIAIDSKALDRPVEFDFFFFLPRNKARRTRTNDEADDDARPVPVQCWNQAKDEKKPFLEHTPADMWCELHDG